MRPIDRPAGVLPVKVAARIAWVAQDPFDGGRADEQGLERTVGEPRAPERVFDEQRGFAGRSTHA